MGASGSNKASKGNSFALRRPHDERSGLSVPAGLRGALSPHCRSKHSRGRRWAAIGHWAVRFGNAPIGMSVTAHATESLSMLQPNHRRLELTC